MATFFGEILPVVSRAVDEDEDDNYLPVQSINPTLRWHGDKEQIKTQTEVSSIHIAIGPAASGFLRAYLLDEDTEVLAEVCCSDNNKPISNFSNVSFTDKACYILRLKSEPRNVFIQCNGDVKPDQYSLWTEMVLSEIWKLFPDDARKRVTVLCSLNSCDYKSETPNDELEKPLLRMLKTDNYEVAPCCPYLETPNVISGLPAQVLSYCQVNSIAACIYVCYVENSLSVDSTCMKAFKPVLSDQACKDNVKVNPAGDRTVLGLAKQLDQHTTLYI